MYRIALSACIDGPKIVAPTEGIMSLRTNGHLAIEIVRKAYSGVAVEVRWLRGNGGTFD
jgi:hypothetical protein